MAGKKTGVDKRLIQVNVKADVKRWIEQQAKAQERSQGWFTNKIIEDAFTAHSQEKAGA